MKKPFHELPIGSEFVEKNGRPGATKELHHRKTTKSKAVCIAQIGYGNTSLVGSVSHFGSFSIVYPKE